MSSRILVRIHCGSVIFCGSRPCHGVLPFRTNAEVESFDFFTWTTSELEEEMLAAANNLEFEKAALCRDQIKELKRAIDGSQPGKEAKAIPVSYRMGKRTYGRR